MLCDIPGSMIYRRINFTNDNSRDYHSNLKCPRTLKAKYLAILSNNRVLSRREMPKNQIPGCLKDSFIQVHSI